MKKHKIDLKKFRTRGVKILSGRKRGKLVREKVRLNEIDKEQMDVEVNVPMDIMTITTSFILAFIGDSVRFYGDEKSFKDKYSFTGTDQVLRDFDDGIEIALKRSNPFRQH